MDPITLLIGLGVQGVATLITEMMAQGKEAEARAIMAEAAKMYDAVELPQLERAVAEQVGPTAFESITVDPAYKAAQLDALSRLSQIADEGGLTLADKAALNQITGQLARRDAAARAATREEMQARGTLGSGAELASRLAAQQESSQLASQRGMDVAAQAQQRALDAIMQRGGLAGQMRGQEFGEQSQAAQAKDIMARYNADARRRAQEYNLGLAQQQFENQMRKTGAQVGTKTGQGNLAFQEAQGTRMGGAGYSASLGKTAEAATRAYLDGEKKKNPWEK